MLQLDTFKWDFKYILLPTEHSQTNGAPGGGHRSHKVPLASLRVPPFHCVQIAPAVMPSYCIHRTFQDSLAYKETGKKQTEKSFIEI